MVLPKSTNHKQQKSKFFIFKNNPLTTVFAAMAGAALMIPISIAVVGSTVQKDLGGQLSSLNSQIVQMRDAAVTTPVTSTDSCAAPAGVTTASANVAAPTWAPAHTQTGTMTPPANTPPVVEEIVTGQLTANTTATISDTGPDSSNTINTTNTNTTTVNNNNSVNLSSSNDQSSSTGNASVQDNTSGGSATSGDSSNNNSTDINILFKN